MHTGVPAAIRRTTDGDMQQSSGGSRRGRDKRRQDAGRALLSCDTGAKPYKYTFSL